MHSVRLPLVFSARGVKTTVQLRIRTGRNSFSLRKRSDDSNVVKSLWWVHLRHSVLFLSVPALRNVPFATRERMKAAIYENSLWEKKPNNMACKCWEGRRMYLLKDVRPDVPGEPECVCACVRVCTCTPVFECGWVCMCVLWGGMHAHVWVCVPVCGCGVDVSVSVCVCFYIHRRWARRCPLIPTKLAWTWMPWNRIKGIPRDAGEEMNQNLCFQLGWN